VLGRLAALLSSLGYRPRREDATLVLDNCPFDRFRADHTEQVCHVNLALCEGYLAGLGLTAEVQAQLRPCSDTCCVVFEAGPA
jgi:predicted ArsR family transcriptional regulator